MKRVHFKRKHQAFLIPVIIFLLVATIANSFFELASLETGSEKKSGSEFLASSSETANKDATNGFDEPTSMESQNIQSKNKTLAVCIVGGLRTFHLDVVRQSLARNVLNALEPDQAKRQVFFHIDEKFHCDSNSNTRNIAEEYSCQSLEKSVTEKPSILESKEVKVLFGADRQIVVDSDFTCTGTPFLAQHQCCINNQEGSTSAWNTFLAYQRKLACLEEVKKHEAETGVYFENFLIIRPDLYFFEPLPPVTTLARYKRLLISAKEAQQGPGDYLFFFPRSLWSKFEIMNKALHEDYCFEGNSHRGMPWPLEYEMRDFLNKEHADRSRSLPYQVFPFFFTIIRPNGQADCFRLKTEVFAYAKPSSQDQVGTFTPEQICNNAVSDGLFKYKGF